LPHLPHLPHGYSGTGLARPASVQKQSGGGLYVLLLFLIFNDSLRPIILTSTGQIIAKFAGLEELSL